MKKITLIIMVVTILSKILGLGREIILSYLYGTSNISDAYLISITIPSVIFGFIVAGIGAGYIPMFSNILHNHGELVANKFTNNLVNSLLIICTIIIFFVYIFAEPLVRIFALGFESDTLALTVRFTKISIIAIYFTGIVSIFTGYLQIHGNYIIPALVGVPLNFFIILSILASLKTDILFLSIGFVVATASQIILLTPFIIKKEYRYRISLDLRDKHIISAAAIALPVIIGISANQINLLVDRTLASQIAVGGISALNYANKLNGFVRGIFVLSMVTVMYPVISKMAAESNMKEFKNSLAEAITGINLLVMPASVGAMFFATPIVKLLFGRGAFDSQAIEMTSVGLFYYSVGMVGIGLREILTRAFYSLHDTKTPMINSAIGMVLNIILNLILSKYLGIGGLALATSISAIFITILLFFSLRKKIGCFGLKNICISFFKIFCVSGFMGLIAQISYKYLLKSIPQNISLVVSIGIGAISYFIGIYFMKIDYLDSVMYSIKSKLKKSKN